MTIDDPSRHLLAGMSAGPPLEQMTVDEARAFGGLVRDLVGAGPDVRSTHDHQLTAADGGTFDVRVIVPDAESQAVVVYLHGGGWVLGGIDESDTLARELATRSNAVVVVVGYRLAPEFPFPAAVEDAWSALFWAAGRIEELAGASVPLIVAGDSAGANLAAVTAQRARDTGLELALQVLTYPVIAADFDTSSYLDPENELILTRAGMRWFWDHYLPDPAHRSLATASPIAAASLDGLAPALVILAEHDVLRSEGEAYAAALEQAGVPVEVQVFEGQMHMFLTMVNLLPASLEAVDLVAARIAAATPVPSAGD